MDAVVRAAGKGVAGTTISPDFHFRIYLAVGLLNLILSTMPSRILGVIELFGTNAACTSGSNSCTTRVGGRKSHRALHFVQYAVQFGLFASDRLMPPMEQRRRKARGMRHSIFHLIFSVFTFEGVDVS